MLRVLWHVATKGHSVRVNRAISVARSDPSRGWLYVCECGISHAR